MKKRLGIALVCVVAVGFGSYAIPRAYEAHQKKMAVFHQQQEQKALEEEWEREVETLQQKTIQHMKEILVLVEEREHAMKTVNKALDLLRQERSMGTANKGSQEFFNKIKTLMENYGQRIQAAKATAEPDFVRLHNLYYVKGKHDEAREITKFMRQLEEIK